MMAIFIRLFGDASPFAAHMWDGKRNGAVAKDAFLRKERRFVIICALFD
jgi:hypothetical protein